VRNPSLNVRNPSLNVRNPSLSNRQWFYLTDGYAIVPVGKYVKRETARKKANNMIARDIELRGMGLVSDKELEQNPSLNVRNPSAAGVGHSVGKHAKYAARGAGRVSKSAWHGTKSFFGSAYDSFKKHNPEQLYNIVKYEVYRGFGSSKETKVFTGTMPECFLFAKQHGLSYSPMPTKRGTLHIWEDGIHTYELRKTKSAKRRNPSLNVR
jgi:hypothetical protein